MESLIDRIHFAMSELSQRPWDDDSLIYSKMKDFEDEIDFLARFVDCICYRSNALELGRPHLSSVVTKVAVSAQKIGDEFLEEMNRHKLSSVLSVASFNLVGSSANKATKWIKLFEKLISMTSALKPDLADALDNLSINTVQCKFSFHIKFSSHNFSTWKGFVISTYKHVQDVQGSSVAHYRRPDRCDIRFAAAPSFLENLLVNLKNYQLEDPKIEAFLAKFGSSIICAELLCCQWWSSNSNSPTRNDILAVFQDLDQIVWLTNPEFVEFIFRLLKTSDRFITIAELVVHRCIPFRGPLFDEENIMFNTLSRELKYLILRVLNMPGEEEDVKVKIFFSDTKQLLMETASLSHLLYEVKDKTVARTLVQRIWLIKIEILLRTQLTGENNIYKVINELDALNLIVNEIRESSDGSTAGTKIMNGIFTLMQEVVKDAALIGKSLPMVMQKLLLKTLFLKGELIFLKLHDSLPSGSFKDYIESLHEGFKLMMLSVINQSGENIKGGNMGFPTVESVASRIIFLYHQILAQNISEEMLINMNASSLPDLLNDIKLIMKQLKESYLSIQRPVFPCTNAVGFSDSLQSKLQELLNYEMYLVESVITKEQISEIIELLEVFQPFLQYALEDTTMSQELKDLCIRAVNLTYEAEYLIDSLISGKEADDWHNMIWLYNFLQEIRDLKSELSKHQVRRTNKVKVHLISRETTPDINKDVVGLADEEQSIIDRLLGGFGKLYSTSIVGMPGIGKTTLAKKVYNSPQVVTQFGIRAWCCVSEVYRKRDILLEILRRVIAVTADMMGMTDEDLEFKLYKILKTKRFLIVLDDVWGTDALDDLLRIFPDNEDKSRILITSRNDRVAKKANPDADPHHLRQLHDDESWMLLQLKVFHQQPCPEELKEIGKEIATSCKGLPLAVIAIAGLLERIERQHNSWKNIAESLSSKIIDDPQEQWRHILELSYENLPDYLKACFLYFGAFLEDQDIPAWKLMQLWIAEGFVPKTDLKTMENAANEYLMDLIGRSLVMLSKQRSLGGAKACRVHDVLRKLCQSKAKEDNFFRVITRSDTSNNVTLNDLDYIFSANFENPTSSDVTYEDHRLCFCSKRIHFIDSRPLGPHVRTLLCFANGDKDPKYPYDISFISQNFRFLKVLDLECINMGNSFAEDILLLQHLKYLAVSGYIQSIPSSIANLWNLETLIVKGLRAKVNIPHQLWCMRRLRHVRISDFAALDFEGNSSQVQIQPDCLVTASSLVLRSGEQTDCFLKKCNNLRKLKCIFSKSPQEAADQKNCNDFPCLEVLNELESLKITYYGRDVGSGDFSFPSNLKKLTLSNFRLPWGKISVIGGLQKLEILKLQSQAFVGEDWEMVEGEFLQLKYLKLDNLDLANWNANSDNLPKLKKLVLRSCKNLEIPVDILDVPALQIVDVQWCGENVEMSARKIREDGDENLKVFINFAELQFPSA